MKIYALAALLLTTGVSAFMPPSASRKIITSSLLRSSTALGPYSNLTKEQLEVKTDELRNPNVEESRKFGRYDEWLKTGAVDRFPDTLVEIFQPGIVRHLALEVSFIAATATFVCLYNCLFVAGFVDFDGQKYLPLFPELPLLSLPATPFTFSSAALALILGE